MYPRSFQDTNGDGVGDLPGVIERLDHLAWLGVDAIWLSPTFPSPNRDWGYDVADYLGVHPELGTPADLDRLIVEAGARGIRLLLDLVPNHSSDQHAWFQESRSGPDSARRDYYVWRDPRPDGSPPNNWRSQFGGPAWTLDESTGQMYLHQFAKEQPDLNWWHEPLRAEFDEILRHWFGRGVAGFRIDTAHLIVKDRELRDNPPADETDHPVHRLRGWRPVHNADQPEVHEVLKRWRAICAEFAPEPALVGEVYVLDPRKLPPYFGSGDELHLAFNFPFVHEEFDPAKLRTHVELAEDLLPAHAWPTWVASNHDVSRFPTRWCGGDAQLARCVALMLLTLRGTPFLYQGDEIGMTDGIVPREELKDPVGLRWWPRVLGRDVARTPMQWSGEPGAGFSHPDVRPWLPLGDFGACNVADQAGDPASHLNLVHDLVRLRRAREDLRAGAYRSLQAPEGAWAWLRGESTACAFNAGPDEVAVELGGKILIGTDRARDGEKVDGLRLRRAEGAVLALE